MILNRFRKKESEILEEENLDIVEEDKKNTYIKNFVDMITPSVIKFLPSHYIFGNTYRQVIAVRNYPMTTKAKAILSGISEMNNTTMKVYINQMDFNELNSGIDAAINKNASETKEKKHKDKIEASSNISNINNLIERLHNNKESMYTVSVYIEMIGNDKESLKAIYNSVVARLKRHKITHDNLYLSQKQGFLSVYPLGEDSFKDSQFERNMPSSSVANLCPLSYSGVIDKNGMYIARDNHGGLIIADTEKRDETHTNSNMLILGNSGEGKTYLLKLLLTNYRIRKKKIISLDPEAERIELTKNLGGTNIDLTQGMYFINVLEPKVFSDGFKTGDGEIDNHPTFNTENNTRLSQHISFLRDFFRTYRPNIEETLLNVLEIMISELYEKFDISNETNFDELKATDYPILSDLYDYIDNKLEVYDTLDKVIYSKEMLQKLLLDIHSICKGSDSKFFNGYTNLTSHNCVNFIVKNLLEASSNLRNAVLFNVLSYMTGKLLVEGDTVLNVDELYLFLEDLTMVLYIRNYVKRVRKKDSAIILASQNIEDFLQKDIAEKTKPLFAIPTYKFLFYPGDIDKNVYQKLLSLEDNEYDLIRSPRRGNCLFINGKEKHHISVHAPEHKANIFGNEGGR